MKIKNRMLYKTIKAIRFYASLFDITTGKSYELVTAYNLTKSGYFLIRQIDDGRWLVLKEVPIAKNEDNKDFTHLPYLTRIQLYQFLSQNFGFSSKVQKLIDSLDL